MKSVAPIRDKRKIELVKSYLKGKDIRNWLMFVIGINSNLRISDILALKVSDVWVGRKVREYIDVREKKTGKTKKIAINETMAKAIVEYIRAEKPGADDYLFASRRGDKPISRQQAFAILNHAGDYCGLEESVAPHTMRKTWGYWAWRSGVSPIIIMDALNHSNIQITKRYLGIIQDDIDNVYLTLNL